MRRRFLWAGAEAITGGKCKVNWDKVCRPKNLGGLGILNLTKFARALRLCWLWQQWTADSKPWVGMELPCDEVDKQLFDAATSITIGNGRKAKFWTSKWLGGPSLQDSAPEIFRFSIRKHRTVQTALQENRWLQDINLPAVLSSQTIQQLLQVWERVSQITLDTSAADEIIWRLNSRGEYTAKSAYELQFIGSTVTDYNRTIWKTSAPPKCKQFAWLAIQNRIWTSDRLQVRGWPNQGLCPLCKQANETVLHLLAECRYSRMVWNLISDWSGCAALKPSLWSPSLNIADWWSTVCYLGQLPPRATATVVTLTTWELWKEHNTRIFNRRFVSTQELAAKIKEEGKAWTIAWVGGMSYRVFFLRN